MVNTSDPQALQERLKEVLADEAFARELLQMEGPEDVQVALEAKDIELSLDEIRQIGEAMRKVQSGEISQEQVQRMADGELSEDELEEVAGGFFWILAGIFGAIAVGGGIAIGVIKSGW